MGKNINATKPKTLKTRPTDATETEKHDENRIRTKHLNPLQQLSNEPLHNENHEGQPPSFNNIPGVKAEIIRTWPKVGLSLSHLLATLCVLDK
ncbi:hypothetical protein V6N12_053263 [Hibiscus sabdariffa]|uniref:Uncharacterized protein n=1 Tax=Hibiscus sabdariffa TaxID=183260 RepID=A0ABR2D712_9ROSI